MWNPMRCRHVGVAAREHGEWLGGLPLFLKLTPPVGFEPTTGCLEGSCSIQLS